MIYLQSFYENYISDTYIVLLLSISLVLFLSIVFVPKENVNKKDFQQTVVQI